MGYFARSRRCSPHSTPREKRNGVCILRGRYLGRFWLSSILLLASSCQHPSARILLPASSFQHRPSSILLPAFSFHGASSLQSHPFSTLLSASSFQSYPPSILLSASSFQRHPSSILLLPLLLFRVCLSLLVLLFIFSNTGLFYSAIRICFLVPGFPITTGRLYIRP